MSEYDDIAAEYGLHLTPERVALLEANGVTPAEFHARAETLRHVRDEAERRESATMEALRELWRQMAADDPDVVLVRQWIEAADESLVAEFGGDPASAEPLEALERLAERLY